VEWHLRIATDATRAMSERISALRGLAFMRTPAARGEQVAAACVELLTLAESKFDVRAVLLCASLIPCEDGVPQLLDMLAASSDDEVRRSAARALRHFRARPQVGELLRTAAACDATRVVRDMAAAALQGDVASRSNDW
jgi:hypothetical protein